MSAEIPTGYRLPLVQEGTWRLPEPTMDAILGDVATDVSDDSTPVGAAISNLFVQEVADPESPLGGALAAAFSGLPLGDEGARFDQLPLRVMDTVSINTRTYQLDPIVSDGAGGFYTVFFDQNRFPTISHCKAPHGEYTSFSLHQIAGRPLRLGVNDGHNSLSVARGQDGRVWVAGNLHNDPLIILRQVTPGDLTSWVRVSLPVGVVADTASYPGFLPATDGGLWVWYRQGGSNAGDWYLLKINTDNSWGEYKKVMEGITSDVGPYPNRMEIAANGRWHMPFMWGNTYPGNLNGKLSYAYSDDEGTSWNAVDGTPLSTPITVSQTAALILDGGNNFVNQPGTAVDAAGRPHFVVSNLGTSYIRHYYWTGSAWTYDVVANAGASELGRPSLIKTASGDIHALYRRGTRMTSRKVYPEFSEEIELSPLRVGSNAASWEPSYDSAAARSGLLRCFVQSTMDGAGNDANAPYGNGTWGGVYTVNLDTYSPRNPLESVAGAPLVPASRSERRNPGYVEPGNLIWNELTGTGTANWHAPGGGKRQATLTANRFHGSLVGFQFNASIVTTAIVVNTPAASGVTAQAVLVDADNGYQVIGRSAAISMTATGVRPFTFNTPVAVVPGRTYLMGVVATGAVDIVGSAVFQSRWQASVGDLATGLTGYTQSVDWNDATTVLSSRQATTTSPFMAIRQAVPTA